MATIISLYWVVATRLQTFKGRVGLFASYSRSPMSKLFRFLETSGKSNGKKWSQIGKLLLIKGVRSMRKKIENFALLEGFFCYWCYYRASVERSFVSRMRDFLFLKTTNCLVHTFFNAFLRSKLSIRKNHAC